jgi:hypothetical protein
MADYSRSDSRVRLGVYPLAMRFQKALLRGLSGKGTEADIFGQISPQMLWWYQELLTDMRSIIRDFDETIYQLNKDKEKHWFKRLPAEAKHAFYARNQGESE